MEDWSRTAEQIMLSAVESKIRLLGITSPVSGSGVSTVARGIAEAFARSGHKALLVDFSTGVRSDTKPAIWTPGSGSAINAVRTEPSGLSVLIADANQTTRALFNNVELLQRTLNTELSGYSAIVMDLPAVREDEDNRLNPLAAARVADAALMVCLTGQIDRTQLTDAVDTFRMAGVNVAGVVLNDFFGTSIGADMADTIEGGRKWPYLGLGGKLVRKLRSSQFLNDKFPYFR